MQIYTLDNFYRSRDWREFRETFLAQRLARDGEYIDDETGEIILDRSKAVLHHKIHLTNENVNNPNISLNPENIELVSDQTHLKLHDRFNCLGRKIYITDCIDKVKISYDLLVDYNRLKKAIGDFDSIKTIVNAWVLYNSLIEQIRTRRGKWSTAIVISSTTKIEYNRIKKLLMAEEI